MGQYIDKSAVVAEIEKRIDRDNEMAASYSSNSEHDYLCRVKEKVYKSLLSFLDTLEVKEVNLEKEANEAWDYIFSRGWDENSRMALKHDEYMAFAKHFFELGLNTQKGE